MKNRLSSRISLGNPLTVPLLFISIGAISFVFYRTVISNEACKIGSLEYLFSLSTLIAWTYVVRWARKLERLRCVVISPVSPALAVAFIFIKIYIIGLLLQYGAVSQADARFQAYGSSVLISLSSSLGALFFPIAFFATRSRALRTSVFLTFVASSLAELIFAPSKSLLFSIIFSIMSYFFLKRKINGKDFSIKLISPRSLVAIVVVFFGQILALKLVYSESVSDWLLVILRRVYFNFDSAIYACRVPPGAFAPNNFFVYTALPVLKRLDASYYQLEFFNVSQWLLYEVFDISRTGRFGYPNDNLFIGLFFGGFGIFSIFVLTIMFFFADIIFSRTLVLAKRSGRISAFRLAVLMNFPLLYQSAQDFFGFLLFVAVFFVFHKLSNFGIASSVREGVN